MQLSRESIISASLEIADTYGLADMTMRRVARHLGVAPGALYWHFPSKQALIAAIGQSICAPVLDDAADVTDTDSDTWVEATVAVCDRLHRALLDHRDGAEIVSAALSDEDLRNRLTSVIATALGTRSDLAPGECGTGAVTLMHFIMGATLHEQSVAALRLAEGVVESGGEDADTRAEEAGAGETTFRRGVAVVLKGLGAPQAI
ncbi:TetR/AcrR family transcriptional regulator [Corynebacterium pygosceleis]|uniref:TetR family transcriptional regulator n=1 Tax=Corynebacterium pygosceleis TaxID=2800406 RepID=A0ABT3WPR3_9CORY|nr:TetR family transcriptional regulator [Corynebacterium pygosceleis]MCL0120530.1 TetR/AcrR family transcriptional regulator [Corynebacterium pygosceleis]MCX7444081.1 TetR family transcriptional regulator [Corynebacterium pygosceleis]